MPRVNLLPWREELRKQRQKNFGFAALGAVLIAGAIVATTSWVYGNRIKFQTKRNDLLKQEITQLEQKIIAIQELESTKERLLDRMNIIEKLQASRPEVVHLFEELVLAVPNGVHLESVRQAGDRITIQGIAQSSTRVSAFMRNIDSSDWLTDPGLNVVETIDKTGSGRASSFTIFAKQTRPSKQSDEEEL
jgi:type IV pilus assembly protein PilN